MILFLGILMVFRATAFMNYDSNISTIDHGFTTDFASFITSFDSNYDFIRSDINWSSIPKPAKLLLLVIQWESLWQEQLLLVEHIQNPCLVNLLLKIL